jgi:hypothetical protein
MMYFMLICSLVIVTVVMGLLFPSDAFAWGPISHLDFGREVLRQVSVFPAAIQSVLSACPKDFLYGNLAADITVGKKYVDYIYNCHNWRVGFLLLNEAEDESQQACAYGYLSHLAADIIAHNFFIPALMIRSYSNRTLGHVYWEMRFDARRPKRIWNLAKDICAGDFSHDDELFQRMLKRTLFSFKTNKRIFNSILNLHRLDQWRGGIRQIDLKSKWTLSRKDITLFRGMAIESVLEFLSNPQKAACTMIDPTGADKLLYAKELRRCLNRARRHRKITRTQAKDFAQEAQEALKKALYQEVELPEVADIFV